MHTLIRSCMPLLIIQALAFTTALGALAPPEQFTDLYGQEYRNQSAEPGGEIWYRFVSPLTDRFGSQANWSFWTEAYPGDEVVGWERDADTVMTLYFVIDGVLHEVDRNDDYGDDYWSRIDVRLPNRPLVFFLHIEAWWASYDDRPGLRTHRLHVEVDTESGSEFLSQVGDNLEIRPLRPAQWLDYGVYDQTPWQFGHLDMYPYGSNTVDYWHVSVEQEEYDSFIEIWDATSMDYLYLRLWLINNPAGRRIQVAQPSSPYIYHDLSVLPGEEYIVQVNNYAWIEQTYQLHVGPAIPVGSN